MTTLKSQAEARVDAERAEELKKRAARQAAKSAASNEITTVECVVLPMGAGKISMGAHVAGLGEAHYEEDEKFTVPLEVAQALKARGFVNYKPPRAEA
jgi:hypothetical protein